MRTLLNPAALTSSNVLSTTGGLFHDPSLGIASSVLPRFHPGLMALTKSAAETSAKVPGHADGAALALALAEEDEDLAEVVDCAELDARAVLDVIVTVGLEVVVVRRVVGEGELVPSRHCEYPGVLWLADRLGLLRL